MTGGVERYVDRGIIPRSISAIFAEVSKHGVHTLYNETGDEPHFHPDPPPSATASHYQLSVPPVHPPSCLCPPPLVLPRQVSKRSDYQFSVHISYLEIYNETGYDLLDPDREVKALEDLPKVSPTPSLSGPAPGDTSALLIKSVTKPWSRLFLVEFL